MLTYEDYFEKSKYWIFKYYRAFSPTAFELDDYMQECALSFFKNSKKTDPFKLFCLCKILYKYVMINLLYRKSVNKVKYAHISDDYFDDITYSENSNLYCQDIQYEDILSIDLKPHLKEVAYLIICGYETKEICEITHKSIQTIYSYVKDIRKRYAEHLGIKNYQHRHLRHFLRTDENKQIIKERMQKKCRKVNAIDDNGNIFKTFDSIKEASNYVKGNVSVAMLRNYKCKGYRWQYAD